VHAKEQAITTSDSSVYLSAKGVARRALQDAGIVPREPMKRGDEPVPPAPHLPDTPQGNKPERVPGHKHLPHPDAQRKPEPDHDPPANEPMPPKKPQEGKSKHTPLVPVTVDARNASTRGFDVLCDETVSYLFLAPTNALPLASVWRKYFDGCPAGSFTVHVHAQRHDGDAVPELPEAQLIDEPVTGELRFSYRMQLAMNKLYGAAANATAPNGCQPRWAQMLSESCAPVTTCSAVHAGLAELRGESQFEGYPLHQEKPKKKPTGWAPKVDGEGHGYRWWFQSQWSTLWMDHARLLLEHEAQNRDSWEAVTRWPVDSHYAINLLYSLGAKFSAERGMTAVAWMLPRSLTSDQESEKAAGHPIIFDCSGASTVSLPVAHSAEGGGATAEGGGDGEGADDFVQLVHVQSQAPQQHAASAEDAQLMLAQASGCGRFFARKFTASCAGMLSEWQEQMRQSPQDAMEQAANLRAAVPDDRGDQLPCNQARLAP